VGQALLTGLLLHRLDPSHPIEVASRLGGDPRARHALRLMQESGLSLRSMVQVDEMDTYDGHDSRPLEDFLDCPPGRLRGSAAVLCLEPGHHPSEALELLKTLRSQEVRVYISAPSFPLRPEPALRMADHLVMEALETHLTLKDLEARAKEALGTGVFLGVVTIGMAGVARFIRGAGQAQSSSWPATLGRHSSGIRPAVTAATLHCLRRGYDAEHTLHVATAAGWLASQGWDRLGPGAPELDLIGQALRLRLGRITPSEAIAALTKTPAAQNKESGR
jgi:hypothetical protein